MEVVPGVVRVSRGVANWYLIEQGGRVIVVDAGVPADWSLLLATLSARGRSLHDVEAVLVTHAHPDHTGFAERARAEAGAQVWIHSADAETARTGRVGPRDGNILRYLRYATLYRSVFSLLRAGGGRVVPIAALSTFSDGETLDLPGRPTVVHTPGHTAGHSALRLSSPRVLFTGDSLVTWNPLTGRVGPQVMPSAFNADTAGAIRSLDVLEANGEVDVLLPGHGEPWREGAAAAVRHARELGRT